MKCQRQGWSLHFLGFDWTCLWAPLHIKRPGQAGCFVFPAVSLHQGFWFVCLSAVLPPYRWAGWLGGYHCMLHHLEANDVGTAVVCLVTGKPWKMCFEIVSFVKFHNCAGSVKTRDLWKLHLR